MKPILGGTLTLAGLVGLIYGAMDLAKGAVARESIVYMVLGGVLFFAGISIIRSTRE